MTTELQEIKLTDEQESVLAQLIEAGHEPDEAREWAADCVIAEQPADEKEPFSVTDMSSANWVMKKLAECDAAESEIAAMADKEYEAIRKRTEKLSTPIAHKREFFNLIYAPKLEEWAKEKLEGQKVRSVKLIHGVVGFRAGSESLVVDDEEAAIAAAEAYPEFAAFVRVKKEIVKSTLKDWLKENNITNFLGMADITVLAHIERGPDSFYIKPEMPGVGE